MSPERRGLVPQLDPQVFLTQMLGQRASLDPLLGRGSDAEREKVAIAAGRIIERFHLEQQDELVRMLLKGIVHDRAPGQEDRRGGAVTLFSLFKQNNLVHLKQLPDYLSASVAQLKAEEDPPFQVVFSLLSVIQIVAPILPPDDLERLLGETEEEKRRKLIKDIRMTLRQGSKLSQVGPTLGITQLEIREFIETEVMRCAGEGETREQICEEIGFNYDQYQFVIHKLQAKVADFAPPLSDLEKRKQEQLTVNSIVQERRERGDSDEDIMEDLNLTPDEYAVSVRFTEGIKPAYADPLEREKNRERDDRVVALFESGEADLRELGKKMGLSYERVREILSERGALHRVILTEAERNQLKDQIVELRSNRNNTTNQIVRITGQSARLVESCISELIRDERITSRTKSPNSLLKPKTPAQKRKIVIAGRKRGDTNAKIAEDAGVSKSTVDVIVAPLVEEGLVKSRANADDETLIAMYNAGSTAAEMGNAIHATTEAVRQKLSRLFKKERLVKRSA